jgi:hypothetical protein
MKRHSRLISFLGALIVFITFVVKDGLADRWKEQASALDTAEAAYSIWSDLSDIRLTVDMIQNNARAAEEVPHYSDNSMTNQRYWLLYREGVKLDRVMLALKEQMSKLDELLEKFPHGHEDEVALSRFQEDYQALTKRMGVLDDLMDLALAMDDGKQLPDVLGQEQKKSKVPHRLVTDLNYFSERINGVQERVLAEAKVARKRNETWATRAWWIAAALYTLGWGLAVVGRLYDVPVSSE